MAIANFKAGTLFHGLPIAGVKVENCDDLPLGAIRYWASLSNSSAHRLLQTLVQDISASCYRPAGGD